MRVVYMGTPDFAVNTLVSIVEANHEVLAVVTQPDKPKGRGKTMQATPVKQKALEYGLTVYQPEKVREESFIATLKELNPDVIVVAAFGQILPVSILEIPKYGCINVHASLLPRFRGAAPIQASILAGDKESGVTIMYMEKGLDTGDMISKVVVPITDEETGESLHDKLAEAGAKLLVETLIDIENETINPIPQDDSLSTYAGMLSKDMGRIDFTKDALTLERLIRGLYPWPAAFCFFGDKQLKILSAKVVDIKEGCNPGEVVDVNKKSFTIACGNQGLSVTKLQLAGKKAMDTSAFLLGNHVEVGMKLS